MRIRRVSSSMTRAELSRRSSWRANGPSPPWLSSESTESSAAAPFSYLSFSRASCCLPKPAMRSRRTSVPLLSSLSVGEGLRFEPCLLRTLDDFYLPKDLARDGGLGESLRLLSRLPLPWFLSLPCFSIAGFLTRRCSRPALNLLASRGLGANGSPGVPASWPSAPD
jgi:hypothetical protein